MLTPEPSPPPGPDAPITADQLPDIRRRLLAVVFRVCPGWLTDQAEDIVQTAMTSVLNLQRKSGESFACNASYLMAAVHNATVDEVRRRFRRPQIVDTEDAGLDMTPAGLPHPEDEALAREISQGIRDCLRRLARPRRIAVTLHLLGYSRGDAASTSGWSPKRAEHLIYRGLADLRTCLTRKGLKP